MDADDQSQMQLFCMNCANKLVVKETARGGFYRCPNRECWSGRNFAIAVDPQSSSFCSCDSGQSMLRVTDYDAYRIFQCPMCRMKLIVAVGDKRIEGVVEGTDSEDVSRVVKDTLESVGITATAPIGPDDVHQDLLVVKSSFETDLRYDLLRLYEHCKSEKADALKMRRKEIKLRVRELGVDLKKWLKDHPGKHPFGVDDDQVKELLAERQRLAVELRAAYSGEYHGLENEIVNRLSNQLRSIRPGYRIAKNPEFGNLMPDMVDPLFGLNAEVKVIDERDDYWVVKGLKQALSYCEIGRFQRAQFILVNFSPARYFVADDLKEGRLGGRVDIIVINLSGPPSSGVKPVTIDSHRIVNFLDIGGAGPDYFIDDTDTYIGRRSFDLPVDRIDEEIT